MGLAAFGLDPFEQGLELVEAAARRAHGVAAAREAARDRAAGGVAGADDEGNGGSHLHSL